MSSNTGIVIDFCENMSVSKLTIAIKDVRNGGCEPLRRWMLHIKPSLGVWTNLNIELDTLKKNNVINCAFSAQSGSSSLNNIINCAFSAQSGSQLQFYGPANGRCWDSFTPISSPPRRAEPLCPAWSHRIASCQIVYTSNPAEEF